MYKKFGGFYKIDNNGTAAVVTTSDDGSKPSQTPHEPLKNETPHEELSPYADCLIRHRRLSAELKRRQSSKKN